MKILLLEDNPSKAKDIRDCVENTFDIQIKIDIETTLSGAKNKVRKEHYDICFIDISLPPKEDADPKIGAGIDFLETIKTKKNFKLPRHIIIISEFDDLIEKYAEELKEQLFYIIKYDSTSKKWKVQVEEKLKMIIKSELIKKSILIAVHGINTRGEWRDNLAAVVTQHTKNICYHPWAYKNFILKIFLPNWRENVLKEFVAFYDSITYGKDYDKKYIVAHSYGTYIVFQALKRFSHIRFDKVIFLGSPIKENTNWEEDELNKKFGKMYFYIGCSDKVLERFAPLAKLGKSGQKGFDKEYSNIEIIKSKFAEHSDCFSKDIMKEEWLSKLLKEDS